MPLSRLRRFQKTYEKSDFIHCVLSAVHLIHSMACDFQCCEKVSYKAGCPGKMNIIFHLKNDHFSPSPSQYFLPTLPAGPFHGKELTSGLSCNASLNSSCFSETSQCQILYKWWNLTIPAPWWWIKDILGVVPAHYLFSAYQSDMEI